MSGGGGGRRGGGAVGGAYRPAGIGLGIPSLSPCTRTPPTPPYTSLVAVGDSFTEGMSDLLPDGSYRGWADVLAARMAARTPGFRYANLAVRGKLIGQIVDEQVEVAAAMNADVVTLVGGLNDTLRPKCDMGRVRGPAHRGRGTARAPSCKQLVLMRSPGRQGPVLERFRPRMEELFACVWTSWPPGTARSWSTCTGGTRAGRPAPVGRGPAAPDGGGTPPGRRGGVADARVRPGRTPSGMCRWRRRPRPAGSPGGSPTRGSPGSTCPLDRPPPDRPLLRRRPPAEAPGTGAVREPGVAPFLS